jgi:hypothetical protein
MEEIKMAPSKARILSMIHPVLIGHYNLIQLKKSSLPSAQRKLVKKRIDFNVAKGKILQAQIDDSFNILKEEL